MKNVHIWIVEDNNADVFLIGLALERTGWKFEKTVIGDGEKAVRMIQACQDGSLRAPDILLLDLSLPKIDGQDVLEALSGAPAFAGTGVAIFSSSALRPTKHNGKIRSVHKPADLDEFLTAVSRTIRELLPQTGIQIATQ